MLSAAFHDNTIRHGGVDNHLGQFYRTTQSQTRMFTFRELNRIGELTIELPNPFHLSGVRIREVTSA